MTNTAMGNGVQPGDNTVLAYHPEVGWHRIKLEPLEVVQARRKVNEAARAAIGARTWTIQARARLRALATHSDKADATARMLERIHQEQGALSAADHNAIRWAMRDAAAGRVPAHTAIHEAGHAVCLAVFGRAIRFACASTAGGMTCAVEVWPAPASVAGAVAERIAGYPGRDSQSDLANVGTTDLTTARCLAESILKGKWRAVQATAAHLQRHGAIDGNGVRAILAQHRTAA